jgi:hypothetical protein
MFAVSVSNNLRINIRYYLDNLTGNHWTEGQWEEKQFRERPQGVTLLAP